MNYNIIKICTFFDFWKTLIFFSFQLTEFYCHGTQNTVGSLQLSFSKSKLIITFFTGVNK